MGFQTTVKEITPLELKKKLDAGNEVVILDVREPHELAICHLDNSAHVPLGELPYRLSELAGCKNSELIVYCRSGKRSERACHLLVANGFAQVFNLKGGILAWADEVDSTVAKY